MSLSHTTDTQSAGRRITDTTDAIQVSQYQTWNNVTSTVSVTSVSICESVV